MDQAKYSSEVRRFILAYVPSVPHLEALLLMRNETVTPWDGARLASRLYVTQDVANGLLQDLVATGLVRADETGGHAYGPADEKLAGVVTELATSYARNVIAITSLIHSLGDRKAQRFADAFRWRKDS